MVFIFYCFNSLEASSCSSIILCAFLGTTPNFIQNAWCGHSNRINGILYDEVMKAIKRLKRVESPASDGKSSELIQAVRNRKKVIKQTWMSRDHKHTNMIDMVLPYIPRLSMIRPQFSAVQAPTAPQVFFWRNRCHDCNHDWSVVCGEVDHHNHTTLMQWKTPLTAIMISMEQRSLWSVIPDVRWVWILQNIKKMKQFVVHLFFIHEKHIFLFLFFFIFLLDLQA